MIDIQINAKTGELYFKTYKKEYKSYDKKDVDGFCNRLKQLYSLTGVIVERTTVECRGNIKNIIDLIVQETTVDQNIVGDLLSLVSKK